MKSMAVNQEQLQKVKNSPGFVAALDQSGGSTPKALGQYGIQQTAWSNDQEMFTVVHQMRTRIITSPAFTGERIIGAIKVEIVIRYLFIIFPLLSCMYKSLLVGRYAFFILNMLFQFQHRVFWRYIVDCDNFSCQCFDLHHSLCCCLRR